LFECQRNIVGVGSFADVLILFLMTSLQTPQAEESSPVEEATTLPDVAEDVCFLHQDTVEAANVGLSCFLKLFCG
jgi:hypothetical protein